MMKRLSHLLSRPTDVAAPGAQQPRDDEAAERGDGEHAVAPAPASPAEQIDEDVTSILKQKILMAWLRNRHQLLFPQSLRRLHPRTARLACEAAVISAAADGASEDLVRRRLARLARRLDDAPLVDLATRTGRPLRDVLADVDDDETASVVYAACLIASDRRVGTCRLWLRYLSARLALSDQLVASLEQRFAAE